VRDARTLLDAQRVDGRSRGEDVMKLKDQIKAVFAGVRQVFDDLEKHFDNVDEEMSDGAAPPAAGETVTTRREELRPDGTRIITTITKSVTIATSTRSRE
jgi:hypothetical protein